MKKIKDICKKCLAKIEQYDHVLNIIIATLIFVIIFSDLIANVALKHTNYQFHMAQMIWFYGVLALIGIWRNNFRD